MENVLRGFHGNDGKITYSILVSMVTNVLDIFGDLDRIASHRFPG